MSRHHILPPIVYVPQPKPKKIEPKKSRIYTRSAGAIEDSGDVEETHQANGFDRSLPAGQKPEPENFAPIEGSERKPHSTTGRLSENTLKAMLLVQEEK
jgi:hypothetical protein